MTSPNITALARESALDRMGANGIRHPFPTADVVIDPERAVFIVCDLEPSDTDWSAVCDLLSRAGYDNGAFPWSADPGEPEFDAKTGTCTWKLALTAPGWPGQPTGPELN